MSTPILPRRDNSKSARRRSMRFACSPRCSKTRPS